jgi:hypothetical protein
MKSRTQNAKLTNPPKELTEAQIEALAQAVCDYNPAFAKTAVILKTKGREPLELRITAKLLEAAEIIAEATGITVGAILKRAVLAQVHDEPEPQNVVMYHSRPWLAV